MKFSTKLIAMSLPALCLVFASAFAFTQTSVLPAYAVQPAHPAITLDPPIGWELEMHNYSSGKALPPAPANFRRLGEVRSGEIGEIHTLTLRFSETVKLTEIKSTADFRIEQGGSCVEGNVYQANATCDLLVRFTPRGPGRRLGSITISHTGSATPMTFGLGGTAFMPVLSFIPSTITTMPGTYPSSQGLLNGAQNLSVDGADTLYAADTGNNAIYIIDSGGAIQTVSDATIVAPWGIAADSSGYFWFSEASQNKMIWRAAGSSYVESGNGTDVCTTLTASCQLKNEAVTNPGSISIDSQDNMIFEEGKNGAAISSVAVKITPTPAGFLRLKGYGYIHSTPAAFGVDASDNLYTFLNNGFQCEIIVQSLYSAENLLAQSAKLAGGNLCGFAGDDGVAGNAEIGTSVGQIAFDRGGNLYFTDSANQRVRRIDASTGIIRTIAGNGTSGYAGDNASALGAQLLNPTGVAVDSQGQVYIISSTGNASQQVIRKLGAQGYVSLGSQTKGTSGTARILTVTNTGNDSMTLTSAFIGGANPADFAIDSHTTSCMLTNGAQLVSGATCKIGILFTPTATGSRKATLTFLDNTATNTNTVSLVGNGVAAATFNITSPTSGQSFTAATTINFSVTVTSASGPAPTGTVQFKVDGANYGTPVSLSAGAASKNVTGLSQSVHTLSATYSGDSNYAAGGPVSVGITVSAVKVGSIVSLSPTAMTTSSCMLPQFTISVSSASGPVPTGEVQLLDGNSVAASGTLSGGKVILTAHPLTSGSHALIAGYSGDALHLPAVSSALIENIRLSKPCTGSRH